jgi:serine/threonine protein kinase
MREVSSGRSLVLKTLGPLMAEDGTAREAFAREEWLAKRIVAPQFPQYIPRAAGERSHQYFLMSLHGGITLQQALDTDRHFTVPEVVALGISLLKGLSVLHRLDVLHRDIKPGNIHLGADGQLRILDLGVSQSAAHRTLREDLKNLTHGGSSSTDTLAGTPSFLAPEQFESAPPTRETDLYAVAVTLYHALTRRYPYGEIEPFQRPRFSEPQWPTRVRREIPQWFENVLLKGVCKDPKLRFGTCEEFVLALERGDAQLQPKVELPLAQRDPLKFWQWVAVGSLVLNFLLIYLLLVR